MNLEATEATVEQPTAPIADTPVAPPELSVQDHAKVYGPGAKTEDPDAPEGETVAEKAERLHHSAEQRRQKTGEFAPGKVKHRAESQKASAEDVPRIRQLTAKLRAAEEEVAKLKAQHAPPAQIAKAEAKVDAAQTQQKATTAFTEPEPTEDDPKYGGDYGKYMRDLARWEGRKAYHEAKSEEQAAAAKAKEDAEIRSKGESLKKRIDTAREKYADFDVAAKAVMARVPQDHVIEAWLYEHPKAEDVVYYLHSNAPELDRVLALPSAIEQFEALTLLAQRFSQTPAQAGTTTAAAERKQTYIPPKPPTVVRTEAQRAADSPPPTDGSLSVAEHLKAFGPKSR